jgi:hypothetical protein
VVKSPGPFGADRPIGVRLTYTGALMSVVEGRAENICSIGVIPVLDPERTSGLTTSAQKSPAAPRAFKLIRSVVMSNAGLPE